MSPSTNPITTFSNRAVLSLFLFVSLTVASPIAYSGGVVEAPSAALAVRAVPVTRPQIGADYYKALANSTTTPRGIETRQLNELMADQGLAIRANGGAVSEEIDNASSLVAEDAPIQPRSNSRIFGTSIGNIFAGLHSARVVPNPKNSGQPLPTTKTTTTTTTTMPTTTTITTKTTTITTIKTTTTTTTLPTTTTRTATTTQTTTTTKAPVATPATIPTGPGCFPANVRSIPNVNATAADLASSWWCPDTSEYGFMGFSYSVAECQSPQQLLADFTRMRTDFGARYVRLYGACDATWFYDAVVDAAAGANVGVIALIWFGFDGGDEWKGRYNAFVKTMRTNPKARYVFKAVAIGSEPLFDWAISADDLAKEILSMKTKLAPFGTQVSMSEMPYGLQINNGAPQVMAAVDHVEGNILPFFDSSATTGDKAWGTVSWSLGYFASLAPGKKILMTQTGWPSDQSVWKANSPNAVSNVASEAAYYNLLDSKCSWFKANGGIGWFAQIWSDEQLGGWGILDYNGTPKFAFKPQTAC